MFCCIVLWIVQLDAQPKHSSRKHTHVTHKRYKIYICVIFKIFLVFLNKLHDTSLYVKQQTHVSQHKRNNTHQINSITNTNILQRWTLKESQNTHLYCKALSSVFFDEFEKLEKLTKVIHYENFTKHNFHRRENTETAKSCLQVMKLYSRVKNIQDFFLKNIKSRNMKSFSLLHLKQHITPSFICAMWKDDSIMFKWSCFYALL